MSTYVSRSRSRAHAFGIFDVRGSIFDRGPRIFNAECNVVKSAATIGRELWLLAVELHLAILSSFFLERKEKRKKKRKIAIAIRNIERASLRTVSNGDYEGYDSLWNFRLIDVQTRLYRRDKKS